MFFVLFCFCSLCFKVLRNFTINKKKKNRDILFFMQMRKTRQPSSFNKVLAASHRSYFIDRVIMGKRWHIQFPTPLLSFLCPSNTRDFGRTGFQTECLSHFDKEKIIQNSKLPERHCQNRTLLLFYCPRTTNNFAFLFFLPE